MIKNKKFQRQTPFIMARVSYACQSSIIALTALHKSKLSEFHLFSARLHESKAFTITYKLFKHLHSHNILPTLIQKTTQALKIFLPHVHAQFDPYIFVTKMYSLNQHVAFSMKTDS